MKVRTQIQIDPEDQEALKKWAHERGISMSAAVRWLIREHLRVQSPKPDRVMQEFLSASGAISGQDDEGEVSREHDFHLYGNGS